MQIGDMTIQEAHPLCQVKGYLYVITRDEKDGKEFIVYKTKEISRQEPLTSCHIMVACIHSAENTILASTKLLIKET